MTGGAPRPFEGIRVLDLTHVLAGPFCTYQLAVLGAETIKIEEPGQGDIARQTGCDRALNRRLMGTGYLTQGANKRCLTLDLKNPRGRDVLKRLVVGADVLVENFRSGAMAALGLGYDDLRAINPRLIYCSMTGFGQEGPKADHNAYDCVIQAISGLMSTTGWPDTPSVKTGAPVVDYASGLSAAFAVSSALFQRERTGRGQYVDCAMLDAAMMLMSSHLTACLWSGVPPKRRGNDLEYAGVSAYQTKDGVLMLGSFRAGQHRRLWGALGRPDLAELSSVADQEEHREALAAALREVMLTRTADEWEEFLAGIHVPGARMRSVAEALELEQLARRNLLHRFESMPDVGRPLTVPVASFRFADGGPRVDTPPRPLGADTDAVLGELGLTAAEIAALREAHVV
ncbi:MAG TPA: CaiB/BaiF CoA-transferase family protein [Methylomirabilota bacterium]|jgi:crotonobetainyl-CoA:carnitine CoA-transferase CaiB-like acyl-CoA transferase|nr:CaiB/BaiF CoA-transferase family protein [Methylomirabilota bacterium]